MASRELTEDLLAELLAEAKAAHIEYERQTGKPDDEWPLWYARYILERLREINPPENQAVSN